MGIHADPDPDLKHCPSGPIISTGTLKYFRIFVRFRGDIRASKKLRGVIDLLFVP